MAGIKGVGGPIPKRSDQRRRRNTPVKGVTKAVVTAERPKVPPADRTWHVRARRWYESLADSGQSRFYEPSDWATAAIVAEAMSRELKPQTEINAEGEEVKISKPLKGASIAAWHKVWTSLLVTEGDRRRAQLELSRPVPEGEGDSNVSLLDDARRRLNGPG